MKKIFYILATIILFAGCDRGGQNDAYYANWEGEYEATEIIEYTLANGEKTTYVAQRALPITIFRDNSLYVQTYNIGNPFIPGVDPDDHAVRIKAPKRIPADADPAGGESKEKSTDNVIVPIIIVNDHGVLTIQMNAYLAPKAIQVISATENELTLLPGKSFEATVMTEDNIDLGAATCNWTYSPIRKEGDTYTWEAEIHQSPSRSFATARHIITMTKKSAQ